MFVRNGQFLVEKRLPEDPADPGYIEIPGGHVERGESLDHALLREMKEELGIQVLKTKRVRVGSHRTTDGPDKEPGQERLKQFEQSPRVLPRQLAPIH